ncbi:hypothetical protein [Rubrivirga sp.]|uniref:hypothetical protein n=1 Tax=Rubrivirga sp. TaxID=1885344 RepID=UPI003B5300C8
MVRLLPLALLALALGACDATEERPPRTVPADTLFTLTYRIQPTDQAGAPAVDVIRYTGLDGDVGTLQNVGLPWTISIRAPRAVDRTYSLEAEVTVGGDVTGMVARMFVDGEPVSEGVVPGEPGGFNRTRTARATYRHRPSGR